MVVLLVVLVVVAVLAVVLVLVVLAVVFGCGCVVIGIGSVGGVGVSNVS